jgi:hypothetical protein
MTLQKWGAFLESVGRRLQKQERPLRAFCFCTRRARTGFDGPTSLVQRIASLVATGTDGTYMLENLRFCSGRRFSWFSHVEKNQFVNVNELPGGRSSGAKVIARSTNRNIGLGWANDGRNCGSARAERLLPGKRVLKCRARRYLPARRRRTSTSTKAPVASRLPLTPNQSELLGHSVFSASTSCRRLSQRTPQQTCERFRTGSHGSRTRAAVASSTTKQTYKPGSLGLTCAPDDPFNVASPSLVRHESDGALTAAESGFHHGRLGRILIKF